MRVTEVVLRQLLRTAVDGIHILDAYGNLLLASDSFYRMLGYDANRPPRLHVSDWDSQWSLEELRAIIPKLIVRAETFTTRHRREDGGVFDVEIHSRGVELDGRLYLYASSRDITERLRAEADIARNLEVTIALERVLRLSLSDLPLSAILDGALGELLALPWLNLENRGCIFLLEEDGTELRMEAHRNLAQEVAAGCSRVALGHCLCGRAAEGRLIFRSDIDDDHDVRFDGMQAHGHYCVPILNGGAVVGVLNAYVPSGHARSDEEERVLVMFADTLAGVVARKRAEVALRQHHLHLEDLVRQRTEQLRLAASVFEHSAEGVLVTDVDGTIVSVNPAFTAITGYGKAEALGNKPSLLRSDRHPPEFYQAMWRALAADGIWQGEIWNRRKSGEAYLEWLTINRVEDDSGNAINFVSVFHDITEMRRKDERIEHLAFHDALTGLPNRTLLQDRLQHALDRGRREGRRLAVIFIDLDRFKAVNDSLGHDVGDLLLQEVAQRIRNRLRAVDTVARMGGDEFVILMEDLGTLEDCAGLAEALIGAIAQPMDLRGHQVEVGASLGIVVFPDDGVDQSDLMKGADLAMYAAKSAGRNTYRFFRSEMQEQTNRHLNLETDLRRAIANGELELFYQPKVSLADGKAYGVEALVRWRHPSRGLVLPADFIPLAEESGLIIDLGAWVLEQACRQLAEWRDRGLDVRIAINVSAKQLDAADLADGIAELSLRHAINPASLEIELTESTVMADPAKAALLFARLRKMGVTVAVDDFGTGYSSLAYLRRLPIDVLKIDRSFVVDADSNDEDAEIVRTILALGQTLKLRVIAEGIETLRQVEVLTSVGCEIAQGYHFSRPLPAAEVEIWLNREHSVPRG